MCSDFSYSGVIKAFLKKTKREVNNCQSFGKHLKMAKAVLLAADILSDEKSCCLVCSVSTQKEGFSVLLQEKVGKMKKLYNADSETGSISF